LASVSGLAGCRKKLSRFSVFQFDCSIAVVARSNNLLNELRDFVVEGIGLDHDTSPINKDFYRQRIHQIGGVTSDGQAP
jgi:hypothetical protein